jgi:hypothetical protein
MDRCKKCHPLRKGHVGPLVAFCLHLPLNVGPSADYASGNKGDLHVKFDAEAVIGRIPVDVCSKKTWENDAGDAVLTSSLNELFKQLFELSMNMQHWSDDSKRLASSNIQMQKEMEDMAASSGAGVGRQCDILSALAAIGTLSAQDYRNNSLLGFTENPENCESQVHCTTPLSSHTKYTIKYYTDLHSCCPVLQKVQKK